VHIHDLLHAESSFASICLVRDLTCAAGFPTTTTLSFWNFAVDQVVLFFHGIQTIGPWNAKYDELMKNF
jgi:hypothetical protein